MLPNGNSIAVSEETAALLRFSLDMAAQTDGALDITLYPVLTAWGFTTGSYQIPTDDELAAKMQLVGYEKVSLKTVVPFCTNGGGGFGNSLDGLKRTCPDSIVADGFECSGSRADRQQENVSKWLAEIGVEVQQ